ncbi:hypothetical protein FocnCong_v012650 [Fusarium oxysporum f. sp. conglutinans]|nr:hypothetical protein FocnCong_v012650 [Fusarium oxysporum f. sp. conglutinans]
MVRRGKVVNPNLDNGPITKNILSQTFKDIGPALKTEETTVAPNPYPTVDEIPVKVTMRRSNRHYNGPNYLHACRVQREFDTMNIKRRDEQTIWNAEIKPRYDEIRQPCLDQQTSKIAWVSCTRIYCSRYWQDKITNDCFPVQVPERREQKPYLIIDTIGYQVTKRYRGSQVGKLEAHTETRERALAHIQSPKLVTEWRQQVQNEIDIEEQEKLDREHEEIQQDIQELERECEQENAEYEKDIFGQLSKEQLQRTLEAAASEKGRPLTTQEKEDIILDHELRKMETAYQLELATRNEYPDDIKCAKGECSMDHPWGKGTRHLLPWRDKKDPHTVHDGQGETYLYENGNITREIDHLKVFVNGRNQGIDFDIIPVLKHDLVLGYPWLLRYNPQFNWRTGQVDCEDHPSDDENDSGYDDTRSQTSTDESSEDRRDKGRNKRIGRTIATLKGQFRQLNQDIKQMKQIAAKESAERLKYIPPEYRIYEKLFQEELDTKLPQHMDYDIEIVLKDGKNPKLFPIYNLSRDELDTLREWINDMLRERIHQTVKILSRIPGHVRTKTQLQQVKTCSGLSATQRDHTKR